MAATLLSRVEHCLLHGSWCTSEHTAVREVNASCPGSEGARLAWCGNAPYCSLIMYDPYTGSFDGALERQSDPIALFFLGERF